MAGSRIEEERRPLKGAVEKGTTNTFMGKYGIGKVGLLPTTNGQAYGTVAVNVQSEDQDLGEETKESLNFSPPKKKFFASWFTPSFIVIAIVILNGDSARGCLFPTLWPLVSSLGGDRIMQGYIVSAFSFGRLLISPFFGHLSEVYGYRIVLITTTIILCAGTLLYTASKNVYMLLASQIIMGIGSGTLGVTRAYVAEQTLRSKRTILLAYLTAVQYAGFTVMPLFGGLISQMVHSAIGDQNIVVLGVFNINHYTSPAYFMSFLSVVGVVLLCTIFKDAHKHHEEVPKVQSVHMLSADSTVDLVHLRVPTSETQNRSGFSQQDMVIFGGILLNIATKGGISIYETLGIEIATHKFGIPAPNAGYIFACFGFMGVCALLRMKQLCYHFNDVQLILGGMALMIACNILLIGNQLPIWRFYAAIFCMYATGYPVGHTAVIGMFSKVLGKKRQGVMMGWFGSAGSLARVLFPIMGGHLAQDFGDTALFAVSGCILIFSALFLFLGRNEVLHMTVREH